MIKSSSRIEHFSKGISKLKSFISVYGFFGGVRKVGSNICLIEKVHYMVKDLSTSEEKIVAKIPVEIVPYTFLDLDNWRDRVMVIKLRGEYGIAQFQERFDRGDILFTAYTGARLAGFAWLGCPPVTNAGYCLPLDEGYAYDVWTFEEFRGNNIMPVIQQVIFDYVRENRRDISKLITHVAIWNKASISGELRAGYQVIRQELSLVFLGYHKKIQLP